MVLTDTDNLTDLDTPSDKELVELAQQGDLSAYTTLYERYLPSVFNRVRYLIPDQDVEDVTQEVFIAVIKSLQGFKFQSKFSTWLWTLTNRKIADFYRKRERTKDHLVTNLDDMANKIIQNPRSNISTTTIDERIVLREGLRTIPEHYREIILLRFAEGLRFVEIAKTRGQTLEATKSLYRRALSSIRKQLVESHEC